MLGLQDKWVFLAYILSIGSALLCVVYGLARWRRVETPLTKEDTDWARQDMRER